MVFASATVVAYRNLLTVRGEPVVYRRGTDEVDGACAIPAEDEFTRESRDGLTVEDRSRAFLLEASALIINGSIVEPEPGDEIEWGGNTYQVASPGGSVPAWGYEGHANFFVRVHTRET